MKDKVKVLIADNYKAFSEILEKILERYEQLEIVGIANNSEEEIEKINELKPDIVITNIKKDKEYTGIEIIKEYLKKEYSPYFFIISSIVNEDVLNNSNVIGYMKKPMVDYDKIVNIITKEFKNE